MKLEELERKISEYINSHEDTNQEDELKYRLNTRIWPEIERKIRPPFKVVSFWWAAASIIGILLIINLSILIQKNNKITGLESEIFKQEIIKNRTLIQVQQIQKELELAQSSSPKIDTIYKTQIISKPLNAGASEQTQNSLDLINEDIKSDFLDSIKINQLDRIFANRVYSRDTSNNTVHFKIDFGEMKFENDNSERFWKLTIISD